MRWAISSRAPPARTSSARSTGWRPAARASRPTWSTGSCTNCPRSCVARRSKLQHSQARAAEIHRFAAGEGLAILVQPIIDLRTREPVGYEALARFRSLPPRPPDEWFAEAAALELGTQLELATIERALAVLPSSSRPTPTSHSTAPTGPCGAPELAALLDREPPRLVVEITEHEPVEDYDELALALRPLRALGVRIAIDDAGAGYASLRHTLALGPDIVKVDISLTRAIDTDRGRRALASALISFADEMDMTIVAEGIETDGRAAHARRPRGSLRAGVPPGEAGAAAH